MAEVTDIRRGPRGSRRRRILLDGEQWRDTSSDVVADVGVRAGDTVEPDGLSQAIDEAEPARAWERALRLLTYRERGSTELVKRLTLDGYAERVVRATVERAMSAGFLDDARFAAQVARGLVEGRGFGRSRVARELSSRGVDDDLAARVLDACCPEDAEPARAITAARRVVGACRGEPARVARRLATRGFSADVAWRAARKVCGDARTPPEDA